MILQGVSMTKNMLLLSLCALLFCSAHAANDEALEEVIVKKYQDVEPFQGKIVAITSNSYYINNKSWSDLVTVFGYIEPREQLQSGGEMGCEFRRISKPDDSHGTCALVNETIAQGAVQMREANNEEVKTLWKAIREGSLEFEHSFCPVCEEAKIVLEERAIHNIKAAKR